MDPVVFVWVLEKQAPCIFDQNWNIEKPLNIWLGDESFYPWQLLVIHHVDLVVYVTPGDPP